MRRGRRKLSFAARWAMPLLVGPAIVGGAMAWMYAAAPPPGSGNWAADAALRLPKGAATAPAAAPGAPGRVVDLGNVPPPGERPAAEPSGMDGPLRPSADEGVRPEKPETVFARVIVVDGGSFRAVRDKKPLVVRVAGVAPVPFTQTCTGTDGQLWKCGAKARAELARLIGGRSVACVDVVELEPDRVIATCRVGTRDIAGWLVEQGWADPSDPADPVLGPAAERARAAGKGRYGSAPVGVIAG
ncbi:thermonuclease family protein [Oharaeibacter diazotrophicus]|uniref:Endonuclease YncB(Thermonuclease family) n=2 Tax=Oharaeibacter diazotrophicus TaxID=1920512 RepID=A0A4R6RA69_9HYPH|nr:thermonuclease family protein [Oharaeibacter diazotrophicus]TDP82536.1 endonuclease YncB(thermonuclease family) [Oharaeibacter diazotrophicus]BBE72700.1 hypothetical protein OHA_1_02298 [Pleomorphomonas sp. SM30]GLS76735.1 hypothetical protein GCM10007904_20720 [Oharaeibacter diazotrophicus]